MKSIPTFLIALAMLIALPVHAIYSIGDTVENFSLQDTRGEYFTLDDHEGKVILLSFFDLT